MNGMRTSPADSASSLIAARSRIGKVAAPGLVASPKAAEPMPTANGLCGAFPEGNDGIPGAAA